jgi:predicted Zn-ribbon and HTH transcriptional regulator
VFGSKRSGGNPGDDAEDDELRLLRELEESEARETWAPPATCPACGTRIDPDQVGASEQRCPVCHVNLASAS